MTDRRRSVKSDVQTVELVDVENRRDLGFGIGRVEANIVEAFQQACDADSEFCPREQMADAMVCAPAERQMSAQTLA